jgi:hypothetical protein
MTRFGDPSGHLGSDSSPKALKRRRLQLAFSAGSRQSVAVAA